ncbi:MAG: hypothetical protein MI741_20550 [Rhodospirillales bacterium]|nr:hypothetical protein [Rhodospirillales bacterium]
MEARGLSIDAGGRKVRLKWHQLRRAGTEAPYDRANLIAGLRRGASLEIDVEILRDGRLVVLHGPTLERETTASGRVDRADPRTVRRIAPDLAPGNLSSGPLLQLDVKAEASLITERVSREFAKEAGPIAAHLCLGSTDYDRVRRLGRFVPEVIRGFDPEKMLRDPRWSRDFDVEWVMATVAATAPDARILYLPMKPVVAGLRAGKNLVEAAHRRGLFVDCWRLEPDGRDSRETLSLLVEAGVDQITTNSPLALERLWLSGIAENPMRRPE